MVAFCDHDGNLHKGSQHIPWQRCHITMFSTYLLTNKLYNKGGYVKLNHCEYWTSTRQASVSRLLQFHMFINISTRTSTIVCMLLPSLGPKPIFLYYNGRRKMMPSIYCLHGTARVLHS